MVESRSANRSPRILLVNFHSSQNAGDAALLQIAIGQLRAAFDQPRIVVSANYPCEPSLHRFKAKIIPSFGALIGLNRKPLWQQIPRAMLGLGTSGLAAASPALWRQVKNAVPRAWLDLIEAFRQADMVLDCPGNHFFTMGRFGLPFLISAASILLAYLFRKPVYIMPQSLGPLNRKWERALLRWLGDRARILFVREIGSLRIAHELGLTDAKVKLVPDLAFSLAPANRTRAESILRWTGLEDGVRSVGVTAITRMTQSLDQSSLVRYYAAMARTLARLSEEHGTRIYFFPQVTGPTPLEDDRVAARAIVEQMGVAASACALIDEPMPAEVLKALYGLMDIFVATRMHSGIFALSMGVPTLFVGYLSKIRGLLDALDLVEWLVELEDVTEERLWERVERLWLQRDKVHAKLLETIPSVVQRTQGVGRLIAEDYARI